MTTAKEPVQVTEKIQYFQVPDGGVRVKRTTMFGDQELSVSAPLDMDGAKEITEAEYVKAQGQIRLKYDEELKLSTQLERQRLEDLKVERRKKIESARTIADLKELILEFWG